MAIDTATKRRSVTTRTMPWARALPVSDGSFDRADRLHLLKLYGAPAVYFWRGAVSPFWSNAANWSLSRLGAGGAGVPNSTIECLVSDSFLPSNSCYVDANATCARLAVERVGGGVFSFNLLSADMAIGTDFIIQGSIVANRGKGNLTIGRDFIQSGTSSFAFVTTLTTETPLMAVGRDLLVDTTGNFGPTKLAGHTITVGRSLSFNRSGGSTLSLNASGAWTLTVASDGGGTAVATNVNVAYSDASGGLEIDASDGTCTDSGNNSNWLFEVLAVPATAGPDYTFPNDRLHYTFPPDRRHYTLPADRKHHVFGKE